MKVKIIWEFEANVEDFDPKYVDIKGLAKFLARRELDFLLQNEDLQADDFDYKVED